MPLDKLPKLVAAGCVLGFLVAGCTPNSSTSEEAPPDAGPRVEVKQSSHPLLWPQLEMLAPPTAIAGMRFGNAVDIDGNRAIVGAPTDGGGTGGQPGNPQSRPGQAFVFVRSGNNWVHEATLTASDRFPWDEFGASVALDGDLAAVGATCDDDPENQFGDCTGAAYIFERDASTGAWSEVQKIFTREASGNSPYFGQSVNVEAGRLVVSAYKSDRDLFDGDPDTNYNDTGSVHIFEQQGDGSWVEATVQVDGSSSPVVLEPDRRFADDQFGINTALSGDTIVVGAALKDNPIDGGYDTDGGAVYVFDRQPDGSWLQVQKIVPADNEAGDLFGTTVAIDGDTLVAGTFAPKTTTGVAYVYRRSSGVWTLEQKLMASDAAEGARFGNDVYISGDWLVVGSPRADGEEETFSGQIYLFERQGTTWIEDRIVTPTPEQADGSFGYQVAIDGTSVIAGAFTFDNPEESGRAFVFEGVPPLAQGEACSQDQRCGSGHCEDGVCCDSACGTCQACVESKTGEPDGTCAPIPAGEDPDSNCTDPTCAAGVQTGNECNGAGACDTSVIECAPYRCAASGGVCGASCAANAECTSDAFCDTSANACVGTRAAGEACTSGDQCGSGNCVDGYCCNSDCGGQCEACDVEGSEGTCSAVTGVPHGERPACVGNGGPCAGTCDGNNRNTCTYPGGSTICGEPSCDGAAEQPYRCDGAGQCIEAATVSCSPFACGNKTCRSECAEDDHCAAGFVCQESNCVPAPDVRCSDDGSRSDARILDPDGEVQKDCAPYICVSGRCTESCSATADCQEGFYCDRSASRCKKADSLPFSPNLGLFCAASAGPRPPSGLGWLAVGLAAAAFGARRRRSIAPCRTPASSR